MIVHLVLLAAGIIASSVAACEAQQARYKALALGALALIIGVVWAYFVVTLGVLSAHEFPETVARWPSPWILAAMGFAYFSAVASFAFLRKLD